MGYPDMPAPTPYVLTYDFTSFQEANPTTPLPADKHEIEYNNISTSIGEIIGNIGLIQRSDGQLANKSVGVDQLADDVRLFLGAGVGDIAALAGIIDDIELLADIEDGTLATAAIRDVAAVADDVALLGPVSAGIQVIADDLNGPNTIGIVAADLDGSNTIGAVAGIAANVTTVAGIAANVTSVAGIDSEVVIVANIAANVTTVAGITASVVKVADIDDEIVIVAGMDSSHISIVASIAGDVATVAGISAKVEIVADNMADVVIAADNIAAIIDAPNSASAAAASALEASQYAAALHGTSVSTLTVGTGTRIFDTQPNKQWQVGQYLRVNNPAVTQVMAGTVVDYSGTTLELLVDYTEGAGSGSDWIIQLSGERGAQGPAGNLADGTYVDITVSGSGTVFTINAGAVDNTTVAAGIDAVKIGAGSVSNTEFGYLAGVTSAIQTQLNAKQATISLTANRAVISNGSGVLAVAATTDTEIGYLAGVTSAIQTQLNGKQATITGGATTIATSNLTASRALVSDGSGKVAVATTTANELGYVAGVTSAIQTQLNAKVAIPGSLATGDFVRYDGTVLNRLPGTQVNAMGSGSGSRTIDLNSGRAVSAQVSGNTTFSFSNPLATGHEDIFTLRLTNGGSATTTWPSSVDWVAGTAPTLTSSGVDELVFKTIDGGTTWIGAALPDVK